MVEDFKVQQVTWYGAHFKWRYTDRESVPRVIVKECPKDRPSFIHYRGQKKSYKVVGLSPNTEYTFELQVEFGVLKHDVTFKTAKCGKHDAQLFSAIEDHNLIDVKKICVSTPEVINIPDKTGNSPLMYAAQRGFPSVIRILHENGGNIDYSNPGGKTALMLAAYHGHSHVITTLMELGADFEKLDNCGCTALHYSIERGNIEICKAFLDKGVDVNISDIRGYTGIISACLADREDVEVVRFLLDNGADPDSCTPSGETCVIATARTHKTCILQLLIQHGANYHKKTRYGYTALDVATPGSAAYEILERFFEENNSDQISASQPSRCSQRV